MYQVAPDLVNRPDAVMPSWFVSVKTTRRCMLHLRMQHFPDVFRTRQLMKLMSEPLLPQVLHVKNGPEFREYSGVRNTSTLGSQQFSESRIQRGTACQSPDHIRIEVGFGYSHPPVVEAS